MTRPRPTGAQSAADPHSEPPPNSARPTSARSPLDRWLGPELRRLLLSQAAPLIASALVTLVTASILGPSERGRLAFVIATASLIGAAACFSLYVGAVNAVRRGQRSAPQQMLALLVIALVLVNALVVAVALLVRPFKAGLLTATTLIEIVSGASLFAINLFVSRTRQGLGDSRAFQHGAVLQSALYLLGATSLAVATHHSTVVVLTWDFALLVSTLYLLPGLLRPGQGAPRRSVRTAVAESAAAHVGIIGQQTLYRADTVLLGVSSSARQVGLYSVATPVAEIVWVASEALSLRTFARANPDSPSSAYEAYLRAVRLNWRACIAGGLALDVGSWLVLPHVLPAYGASVHLIWLLSPGMVFQGYARIGLSALIGAGRRRAAVRVGLASALSVAVYIPLIVAFDATGAAIGSSCAYLLQALAVRWLVRSELSQQQPHKPRHRRTS